MKKNWKKLVMILFVLAAIFLACIVFICSKNSRDFKFSFVQNQNLKDPNEVGTVKIEYLTKDGDSLGSDSKSDVVGTWYETSRKSFESYVAYGDEPLNKKGYIEQGETVVKYIYEKANYINTSVGDNNEVTIDIFNKKATRELDFKIKSIASNEDGTKESLDGVEYGIKADSNLLKEGKSKNGELFVGTVTVRNETETIYSISETEGKEGFVSSLKNPFDLKLIRSWNSQTNKYDVSLDYDHTIDGIDVELTDTEIIVTIDYSKKFGKYTMNISNKDKGSNNPIKGAKFKIYNEDKSFEKEVEIKDVLNLIDEFELSPSSKATEIYTIEEISTAENYKKSLETPFKIEVNKNFDFTDGKYDVNLVYDNNLSNVEINKDNDGNINVCIYSEEDMVKYDLKISYFVESINSEDTNRAPKISLNENGILTFDENKDRLSVSNNQNIILEARAYNLSDLNIEGKSIKVSIPKGFIYNPEDEVNKNFKWKMYKQNNSGILVETDNEEEAEYLITPYLKNQFISKYDITTKNYLSVKVAFSVDESKIKNSRDITTKAESLDNTNDTNLENNISYENLHINFFDLKTEKFIEYVEVINDEKTERKDIGFDKKSDITKIDISSKKIDSTDLKIMYGIKISNVGEIAGRALELTDFIPEGFSFDKDKNPNWYKDGDVIKTTILNNTILEPGESTIVYIELNWDLNKEAVGKKVNNAEISLYYNEPDAKDVTEDNSDSKELIVTVKTGAVTYVSIVVIVLFVLAVIVYEKKLKLARKGEKHVK